MDFIQVMPGMPKAKVRGRVVMSPHHVKRLLGALAENVQRFEKQHGPIQIMDRLIQECPCLTWAHRERPRLFLSSPIVSEYTEDDARQI